MEMHHAVASYGFPSAARQEAQEGNTRRSFHLAGSGMAKTRRAEEDGFRKVQVVGLLRDRWLGRDYIQVQRSRWVHIHVVGFRVQGSNMRGRAAEAQREHRPPGPAAASPRRSPRFRARSVALALEFLGEGDVVCVRGRFDVEMIAGVLVAAGQVPRLSDGDGLKFAVARPSLMAQSHPGICGSNYLLQPSPNTRLFRDCRQPM